MPFRFSFTIVLFITALSARSQYVDSTLLKKHIYYLASDKLKGRAPGTPGEKAAAKYIAEYFKQHGLTPKGTDGYYQPFTYQMLINPHDTISSGKTISGRNIIGFLDNKAQKTMVIGAHFDHLGNDGRGSSLEKKTKGKIHNGADDNASGTAGVLELAHWFSSNHTTEPVNFLFICFSAEEAGLIGSKYFTNHPTINLTQIHSMLNMDMIGRLVDSSQKLLIYGVGTGDVFVEKLNEINRNRFVLVLDSSGIGPSDQTSFYLKQIPVLHFFTGQHTDYHKPGDDASKINYTGESRVLDYMVDLINEFSSIPIAFHETTNKESGKTNFKVTLGVMPDYSFQGKGLKVDAVTKDKPGDKAGLKAGDIVLQLGDTEVKNIYDYMGALGKYSKGDNTTLKVQRGEKKLTLKVVF